MKRTILIALATIAFAAVPANAITFSNLTTIYTGVGVYMQGSAQTNVHCSNVSGQAANVRFLFLHQSGSLDSQRTVSLQHGQQVTGATGLSSTYAEDFIVGSGNVENGVLVIESTQSGVFCNAAVIVQDGDQWVTNVRPIPLVRINAHPGTIE
jgi:hypothetical protein